MPEKANFLLMHAWVDFYFAKTTGERYTYPTIYTYVLMLEQQPLVDKQVTPYDHIDTVEAFPTTSIPIFSLDALATSQDIILFVDAHKELLVTMPSIFITKANRTLLSTRQVQILTTCIKNYNPTIRIMIDQEGGQVRRYKDFDEHTYDWYHTISPEAMKKWSVLTPDLQTRLAPLLEGEVFPSLAQIGQVYDTLTAPEQALCLDYITYMRLITLKQAGINTYGLVCDLSRGNPVITGLERSFSPNADSYVQLGKYMVANAAALDMGLYLKHFPGHGSGGVDTHEGVLQYTADAASIAYLQENMQVFARIMAYKDTYGTEIGLMVGHMIVPMGTHAGSQDMLDTFVASIAQADYMITDDLSMQGHIQATGLYDPSAFYTTDLLLQQPQDVMQIDFSSPKHITH